MGRQDRCARRGGGQQTIKYARSLVNGRPEGWPRLADPGVAPFCRSLDGDYRAVLNSEPTGILAAPGRWRLSTVLCRGLRLRSIPRQREGTDPGYERVFSQAIMAPNPRSARRATIQAVSPSEFTSCPSVGNPSEEPDSLRSSFLR